MIRPLLGLLGAWLTSFIHVAATVAIVGVAAGYSPFYACRLATVAGMVWCTGLFAYFVAFPAQGGKQ